MSIICHFKYQQLLKVEYNLKMFLTKRVIFLDIYKNEFQLKIPIERNNVPLC